MKLKKSEQREKKTNSMEPYRAIAKNEFCG